MSIPPRPFIAPFLSHTTRRLSPSSSLHQLRELAADQFEHLLDRETVHERLANLRSQTYLGNVDQVQLSELNEAQRLQQAWEHDSLAPQDQAEAYRLRYLCEAFATPEATHSAQTQTPHLGEQWTHPASHSPEPPALNPSARLADLRSREAHLSPVEQVELFELNEAQRLQRALEHDNPFQRNRPAPVNQAVQHNMPGIPMQAHELFGRNLNEVTLLQGHNQTCYLLSALDAIMHHPQGGRILDLIRINRVPNGYLVRFPAHPEPIHVPETALYGANTPSSNHIGVPIIWNAYMRLPGALPPNVPDTTHNALRRIFGNRVVDANRTVDATLTESNQLRDMLTESADIWTATRLHRNAAGRASSVGDHYFSIRPNLDLTFDLVNPFNTGRTMRRFEDQAAFQREFNAELTRINLG